MIAGEEAQDWGWGGCARRRRDDSRRFNKCKGISNPPPGRLQDVQSSLQKGATGTAILELLCPPGTGWVSPLCSTSLAKTPGARNSHGRAPSYRTLGNELVHSQPNTAPCCRRAARRPSPVGSAHRLAASRRCCALAGSAALRELTFCFSPRNDLIQVLCYKEAIPAHWGALQDP